MLSLVLRRIIWREYLVYALIFTLISLPYVWISGATGLVYAFWAKITGFAAIMIYILLWRMKYMYLFFNLGYGRRQLIALFLAVDLILSGMIYLVILLIRNHLTNPVL